MEFLEQKIETLLGVVLIAPLLCAALAVLMKRLKTYTSIPIFVVSFLSSLVAILIANKFLDIGGHFLNTKLFGLIEINIEPINLIFLCMVSFLWSMTNLYSLSYLNMNKEIIPMKFYFFLSLSIFFTFCISLAPNLIVMFIFYELLTIFTYPLVSHLGGKEERNASRVYLYVLMGASVILFLPAILYIRAYVGHTVFAVGGIANFLPPDILLVIFLLFFYGVAKSAIVPMHVWLPKAMVASFPVSAVLHAVAVVKSGIFILVKISVYIFGLKYLRDNLYQIFNANLITILCIASLITSSLIALYQSRIKPLLAYSTINQLSICLLALSMFHPLAIKASIVHMVSHALGKITLFFASGYVYCNSKISNLKDFRGLGKKMKLIMAMFTIAALSIIGLPIFAGFISKAYIFYAALYSKVNYWVIVALTISVLMTAHYFIKILYSIYDQKTILSHRKELEYEQKLSSSMTIAIFFTSLCIICFVFIYEFISQLMDAVNYG